MDSDFWQTNRTPYLSVVFLAALLVFSGCEKAPPPFVPASGKVTLNGKPLGKAEIRFIPLVEDLNANFICSATSDDEGNFSLAPRGSSDSGCCACKCKVLVMEASAPDETYSAYMAGDPGPMERYNRSLKNRPIPPQYGRMSSTPLTIEVTADQETYDLELTR